MGYSNLKISKINFKTTMIVDCYKRTIRSVQHHYYHKYPNPGEINPAKRILDDIALGPLQRGFR